MLRGDAGLCRKFRQRLLKVCRVHPQLPFLAKAREKLALRRHSNLHERAGVDELVLHAVGIHRQDCPYSRPSLTNRVTHAGTKAWVCACGGGDENLDFLRQGEAGFEDGNAHRGLLQLQWFLFFMSVIQAWVLLRARGESRLRVCQVDGPRLVKVLNRNELPMGVSL